MEEDNILLSRVSEIIYDLENQDIFRDLELVRKARDMIDRAKDDKETAAKLQLAKEFIENRLTGKMQVNIHIYDKLLEFHRKFKEKMELTKAQEMKLEGLALLEETDRYNEEIESGKNQLEKWSQMVQKIDLTIEAFQNYGGKLANLPK